MRKAAENGRTDACLLLAQLMYINQPYARKVGRVEEAAGVATLAGFMGGHDIPPEVWTGVLHWLRKGGHSLIENLVEFRKLAVVGGNYCFNDGCEVVGVVKDFKVCPQCKDARYCGAACQKADWTTGGHKASCAKAEL